MITHLPSICVKEPELSDGPTVDENIRPALAGMQALLKEYEEVRSTCGVGSCPGCSARRHACISGTVLAHSSMTHMI